MTIDQVDAERLASLQDGVVELVRDSVESGSSIGFVLPLADGELEAYVADVIAQVTRGSRIVLLALDGDRVAGMVQLEPSPKANSRHRAEVQKLIVRGDYRRQGLARRLMAEVEQVAASHGRTLLVLDTEQGSGAESLYRECGYTEVGVIPRYAALAHGGMIATVVFFKDLG